jgi:general secretion pathway protein H
LTTLVLPTTEQQDSGFSLTEMLVVLAVIGFAMSIAVPFFHSHSKPTAAKTARAVMQAAHLTRLTALQTGRPAELMFDLTKGIVSSSSTKEVIELAKDVLVVATLGQHSKSVSERASITFYPDGSATGGQIKFYQDDELKVTLSVNWVTGIPVLIDVNDRSPH